MEMKYLFALEYSLPRIQGSGFYVLGLFYLLVSRIAALDKFLYYCLISILLMWDYTFFSLHFTYGITSFNSQRLGARFRNMHRDTAEPSIKKRKGSFYTLTCLFRITLKHWWQQGIIVPAVELRVLPWAIAHPATACARSGKPENILLKSRGSELRVFTLLGMVGCFETSTCWTSNFHFDSSQAGVEETLSW